MPIFRHDDKLHYFAHVPKAGGRSVESYLRARFGELAMIDDGHHDRTRQSGWLKTTPQHVVVEDLSVLFPPDWFESCFAVVRNPIARFVSAFNFQSTVWRQIPVGMTPDEWLDEYLDLAKVYPFYYDNHLRAQDDFVPAGAKVFRLEDGLADLIPYLDQVTGSSAPSLEIGHDNASKPAVSAYYRKESLSSGVVERLADIYAADFQRFGYTPSLEQNFTVYLPTRRFGAQDEQRRMRGRSLWLRRGWRQAVKRSGKPIFMF